MRTNITIATILLVISLRGYFCAISERFQEVQNAKGKQFTMTVMKEVSRILEDCAVLCLLTKTCLSFFHDETDGTCRFVAGKLEESEMTATLSRPGMLYFISDSIPDGPDGLFCPEDFDNTSIPGVCFKKIETKMDNDAGRTLCKGYSSGNMVGHLLTVYTLEMYTKLSEILSDSYHIDGYKRLPDETWVDWKGYGLTEVLWDSGEPDNRNGDGNPTKEQCMFILSNGEAHDIPCSGLNFKIVCQLEYVKRI